jgi:hypothetical protein
MLEILLSTWASYTRLDGLRVGHMTDARRLYEKALTSLSVLVGSLAHVVSLAGALETEEPLVIGPVVVVSVVLWACFVVKRTKLVAHPVTPVPELE